MSLTIKAYSFIGVKFTGLPKYIDFNVYLDPAGGLELGSDVVISIGVVILTHDYSITTGLTAIDKRPKTDIAFLSSVTIGDNCFIGANSTILPGTRIGNNVIISAGSVVKGYIRSNSIIAGNPAVKILNTDSWAEFNFNHLHEKRTIIDKR
jgi:acetyltransferase-like isoleucine patch superfamily enzyme